MWMGEREPGDAAGLALHCRAGSSAALRTAAGDRVRLSPAIVRVVVTGSSGMVGSVLSERLIEEGHDVVPVDRAPNPWNTDLDVATRLIDLLEAPAGYDLPSGIDVVVHCAANARVHELVLEPLLARENYDTSFHALEFARSQDAHFIFTSSREVYGNQGRERYDETQVDAAWLESPYAASKLATEDLTRAYGRAYGTRSTIVRLSNVYGRHDTSERFVPVAIRRAMAGASLAIFGAEKRLDFTYVDDSVDGLVAVIERLTTVEGEVLNIASGHAETLIDAAESIATLLERPLPLKIEPPRAGEVIAYEADITKARGLLEYEPRFRLSEGLVETVRWHLDRGYP